MIPKSNSVRLADPRFGFVGQSEPARRAQVIRTTLLDQHFARLPASVGSDLHAKGFVRIASQFAQPLSGTELGIAGRSALRLYGPATGHLRKSIALGPNAALQLAGITSRLALLRGPRSLVLVRLSDGALVSFPLAAAAAERLVDAKLTAAGLFYAYNAAKGKAKGRIVFEPTSRLLARF